MNRRTSVPGRVPGVVACGLRRGLTILVMMAMAVVGLGTAAAADEVPLSTEPDAAPATAPTSYVAMTSQPGASINAGASALWRTGAGQITTSGSPTDGITVSVSGGTSEKAFDLSFRAPAGAELDVGSYEDPGLFSLDASARPSFQLVGLNERCTGGGRFTIRDLAPDLSRLWIHFEKRCPTEAALTFGEIQINAELPVGLTAMPSSVRWPAEYPHVPGTPASVTLVNTGPDTVGIETTRLTGDDDFAVLANPCTAIPAAGACALQLGFEPRTGGERDATLAITTTEGSTTDIALVGQGHPGHTGLAWFGEYGNPLFVGEGSYAWPAVPVRANGSAADASVSVSRPGQPTWTLTFEAPLGSTFAAGQTLTAGFQRTPTSGAFRVRGSGHCGLPEQAEFTVHEYRVDEFDRLAALSITFTYWCGFDEAGRLFGTVTYRSSSPPQPVPGITGRAPASVKELAFDLVVGGAHLTWATQPPPDWADTVVRGVQGMTPPASPSAGFPVRVAPDRASATITGLNPGSAYSFSVFVRDTEGKASAPTSRSFPGSAVTLRASKSRLPYWSKVALKGALREANGAPVPNQIVEVWCREPGRAESYFVGQSQTDSNGNYVVKASPALTYEYFAFYDGGSGFGHVRMGDVAGPVRVKVTMGVDAIAEKRTVRRGASFKIATAVGPASAGMAVHLQERIGKKWVTIATTKLRRNKATFFTVRPTTTGTHQYRVFKPGNRRYASGTSAVLEVRVT